MLPSRAWLLGACCAFWTLACAPVEANPIVVVERNDCVLGCGEGSCDPLRGRCVQNAQFPYVLVLPMPNTAYHAPSVTYTIPSADVPGYVRVTNVCLDPERPCFNLPVVQGVTGRYEVSREVAASLGVEVGAARARVPFRARYRPLLAREGGLDDARAQGLPAGRLFADRSAESLTGDVVALGGTAQLSKINLAPGDYEVIYEPDPSVAHVFPPRVERVAQGALPSNDLFLIGTGGRALDPLPFRSARVRSNYRSLDGFSAYLAERGSGQRVSRLQPLRGGNTAVVLATAGQSNGSDGQIPDGVELVVEPPAGSLGVPSLRGAVVGGRLLDVRYPELPPPAVVVGSTVGPDGRGVRASVQLVSLAIDTLRDPVPADSLHYTTLVDTDDRGRFSTVVPQGRYTLLVAPADDSGMARLQRIDTVQRTTTLGVVVQPLRRVRGRVRLFDGRPLAGAAVSLVASASVPTLGVLELPRPAMLTTDADGSFEAAVDPGSYDLTITPDPSSGFPRRVVADVLVGTETTELELGELVVAPPQPLTLRMRDGSGVAVGRAIVRIFARAEGSRHYVEVAQSMSDADGEVELLLAPPTSGAPTAD